MLLDGEDGVVEGCWTKLRWARCKARRALSSWASLSSLTNFLFLEEGEDGGVGLLLGIEAWTCSIGFMSWWEGWMWFWDWVCSSKGSFGKVEWDGCGVLLVSEIVRLSCGGKMKVSFGWNECLVVGWLGTTSLIDENFWHVSSFLLHTGLTVILAPLVGLVLGWLGDDMMDWVMINDEWGYL